MKKLKAFTLAEVLIVMSILGVLAVLTVPNMINNVDAQKRNTSFKKAYNSLSSAYGSYFSNLAKPQNSKEADRVFTMLNEKLSVDYYYKEDTKTGTATKEYDKTKVSYADYWIKTNDGMAYKVLRPTKDTACATRLTINGKTTSATAQTTTCLYITVDYNGIKGPNTACEGAGVAEGKTVITDDDIAHLSNCDRISYYVADTGITAGHPEKTIAGALIGGD